MLSSEKKCPVKLSGIKMEEEHRIHTGMEELDRVLGAELLKVLWFSWVEILALANPHCFSNVPGAFGESYNLLYISGEESLGQIKMRAQRLGEFKHDVMMLCETNLDLIEEVLLTTKPDMVIIDSIQTMYREDISSAPGSVNQVRRPQAH